jgi:hypothetical protein
MKRKLKKDDQVASRAIFTASDIADYIRVVIGPRKLFIRDVNMHVIRCPFITSDI